MLIDYKAYWHEGVLPELHILIRIKSSSNRWALNGGPRDSITGNKMPIIIEGRKADARDAITWLAVFWRWMPWLMVYVIRKHFSMCLHRRNLNCGQHLRAESAGTRHSIASRLLRRPEIKRKWWILNSRNICYVSDILIINNHLSVLFSVAFKTVALGPGTLGSWFRIWWFWYIVIKKRLPFDLRNPETGKIYQLVGINRLKNYRKYVSFLTVPQYFLSPSSECLHWVFVLHVVRFKLVMKQLIQKGKCTKLK